MSRPALVSILVNDFQMTAVPGPPLEVGHVAHLFFALMQMNDLTKTIEERLASAEPEVEVLAVEQIAAERLRLTIDSPGGVDLELCERVTKHLRDLLLDYGLEVSSPGPQRPLTQAGPLPPFLGSPRARTPAPRP